MGETSPTGPHAPALDLGFCFRVGINLANAIGRSQRGNNNGYCQDNEISWFDWSLLEKHPNIYRLVKTLMEIRHRQTEPVLPNLTLNQLLTRARIECHGVKLHPPDWSDQSHSLAISASAVAADLDVYLMRTPLSLFQMRDERIRFELTAEPISI